MLRKVICHMNSRNRDRSTIVRPATQERHPTGHEWEALSIWALISSNYRGYEGEVLSIRASGIRGGSSFTTAMVSSYTVGQRIEYWSESHAQWVPTKVNELKEIRGEKMLCTKYKPAQCVPIDSVCVRPFQQGSGATGPASQTGPQVAPVGPPVSLGPAAPTGRRERGIYSDEARRVACSLLGVHGSVHGIFENWGQTYAKDEERKELKDKILRVFSKEPMQGVCYVKLSNPGARVGQAHPSMLNFVPAVFDLYNPYTIDFQRELDDVWTYGFTETLKLKVYSPSLTEGCWSDFAYGPDGSYSDFVKYSVIAFLVIATSSDGLLP